MAIKIKLKKICAAAALCTLCGLLAVQPGTIYAAETQNSLSADDIRYDTNTGDAFAKGNVVIVKDRAVIKGAEADGNTEKEILRVRGNVDGKFPDEGVTLKSDRASWTGDSTKKTDGTFEAQGNVKLTREPKDWLNADYVRWQMGTKNYWAKGKVNGVLDNRVINSDEFTRINDKFWAREVRRYEDKVKKFALSAKSVEGRIAEDPQTGDEDMTEMVAEKNVIFDYIDKEGKKTKITGNKAVYSKARGTVVVSGNTKAVRSDGKTVTADTMVMHEDTKVVEAKGNSRIVFFVEEKEKNTPANAKSAPKDEAKRAKETKQAEKKTPEREPEESRRQRPDDQHISYEEEEWVND